ncbi:protein SOB FIVE-LIKE 2 [Fagus crenata]|uniref:Uncharacterized protein n=1 Tax=Fagus sylvatica TaxID=28930 RepID=A0A2N9H0S3_FAGSY
MESSQALAAAAEEHSGSESGWTMYIGSPIKSENDNYKDIPVDDDDDDESDNSMASDASSGPSHHELPCAKGEGSGNMGHFKHAKNEANTKYSSSGKKPCKNGKKKDEKRRKEEKEESMQWALSAASQVSSGVKVRKDKMVKEE